MHNWLGFFGAFNPPTLAHIELAEFAMQETGRDGVLFVPSRSQYIRVSQQKDFAYSDSQRLEMLEMIAASRPWMQVTDIEIRADHQPRTYETLLALRDRGIHATLLLGSDKLPELESGWLYVREICETFGVVCLTRGRDACEAMIKASPFLCSLSACIRVLETPETFRDLSSSLVRQMVRDQADAATLPVPPEIRQMVMEGMQ